MVELIGWLTSGIETLFLTESDFSGTMAMETAALYNTFVVSVASTVATLSVGAVLQAFFGLFGAFFSSPRQKKVGRK